MWIPFYSRFIGGYDIATLSKTISNLPYKKIIDYAIEYDDNVDDTKAIIKDTMSVLPNNMFALKLTALGLDKQTAHDNVRELCRHAIETNNLVVIDAEHVAVQDEIDQITYMAIKEFNSDYPLVYQTYQMYRKDSLIKLMRDLKKYDTLGAKICRGAYHSQDKRSGKLHESQIRTHAAYNRSIAAINTMMSPNSKAIFATHNEYSLRFAEKTFTDDDRIAYAQLLGMADSESRRLHENDKDVYKYVPFGPIKKTCPYLWRRLIENYSIIKYAI